MQERDDDPKSALGPERSSLRPSRPPHTHQSLSKIGRVLFVLAWIGGQGALIVTANRRPDGAFGFREFSESTTMRIALYREVAGARTRVADGAWDARDPSGVVHRFSWYDRVRRAELGAFEQEILAPHGARAELAALQAALDDVASHVPQDAETRRLLLDVTLRRNGREPQVFHLASAERATGGN